MPPSHLQIDDVAPSPRVMRACMVSGVVGLSFALMALVSTASQSKKRATRLSTQPATAQPMVKAAAREPAADAHQHDNAGGMGGPLLSTDNAAALMHLASPEVAEQARRYRDLVDRVEARAPKGATRPRKHFPVDKPLISSGYGLRRDPFGRGQAFHGGIDFAGRTGEPVRAAAGGVVIHAGFQNDYGNVVRIDHGNGHVTLYAHNQRLLVRKGQRVKSRQQIARLGSTGRSTAPHLHFEVRVRGRKVDPKPFLTLPAKKRG